MKFLKILLCLLGFRTRAIDSLAERQSVLRGVICFVLGFLAFAFVRNAESLEWMVRQTGGLFFIVNLQILEVLLFLAFIYIPVLILAANVLAGDSPGLYIPCRDYRSHLAVLFPLWGLLYLIVVPLQWLVPHGVIIDIGDQSIGIYVGTMIRALLSILYTFWVIKYLNPMSSGRALGVLGISCLTFPVYFLFATFWQACILLVLILLIGWTVQRMRARRAAASKSLDLRRRLQKLAVNPQDADASYQAGCVHFDLQHLDAAQDYFTRAVNLDAGRPEYHYSLGRVYELKGNWARAAAQYEETYQLDPDYESGLILRETGKGRLHTGSAEKGKQLLELFLSKQGDDLEGRYWLSFAYQKLGAVESSQFHRNVILDLARSSPRSFKQKNREWILRARDDRRGWKRNPVS